MHKEIKVVAKKKPNKIRKRWKTDESLNENIRGRALQDS